MADAPEVIRRFYAAINAGGYEEAEAAVAPGVRWVRPPNVPISGTIEGREGVTRMWRAFREPLVRFEIEPTRIREAGEGFLAHVTFRGRGGDPGAESEFEFAGAQTFRLGPDGLIAEVREFKTIGEAEADLAG